jgi:S1-C subfamily serine protease
VSTIAEIEAVLPKLTAEELMRVEQAVHRQFRERGSGIVYDDAHGIETEADLIAAADEAFKIYDQAEAEHAQRKTR